MKKVWIAAGCYGIDNFFKFKAEKKFDHRHTCSIPRIKFIFPTQKLVKLAFRNGLAAVFFLLAAGQGLAKEDVSLQNIVVTAQKQDQHIKDVPISLSVFNEFDIEDKGIENYKDLANFASNVTLLEAGGTGMMSTFIRGVASDSGVESANAGIYVDGVPYVYTFGNDIPIEQIQRIEILKGPQCVLYGKNSYAGVVNIISKEPAQVFEGSADVTIGSDDKRKLRLDLSTPLIAEKLNVSLFARHYEKDGFIHNTTLNNEDNYSENNFGKLHFRFTPTDRLMFSLISSVLDTDDGAPTWNMTGAPDRLVVQSGLQGTNQTTNVTHALKGAYNLSGGHQLTSLTTVKHLDNRNIYDADFSPANAYHIDADMELKEYSQELRLTGILGRISYMTGLYADNMEKDRYLLMCSSPFQKYNTQSRTLSVFANGSMDLTPNLNLSLGARLDRDEISLDDTYSGLADEHSYTNVSPKISLSYAVSQKTTAYATISRGYKSGGYYLFAPTPDRRWVDKEEMTNYEIGAKSNLTQNFSLGTAVFFMDIRDKQVTTQVDPVISYVDNAAQCETMGFEVDAKLKLTPALSFNVSFGMADSEFKTFSDGAGDYSGNKNPFSPLYTYAVNATYRDTRGLFATAGVRGQDKMYTDKENQTVTDAYYVIDAKIGYEAQRFDVYLYANNLTKEIYDTNYQLASFLSSPRELGVQCRVRF